MHVDGRQVTVTGSLLQPLTRRTNDMLRVALSGALLTAVITSSLVTRTRWDELEKSISRIVGVLTPTQSDVVYLVYGLAVLALPFMILIGLILAQQWRLLIPYAAAAFIAVLALSITGKGLAAPKWHFDLSDRLRTVLSQSSTTRAGSGCSLRCSPCPARGCPRAGGTGGGPCYWPSSRSTCWSARSCPPARCWGWRWAGSSARW